MEQNQVKINLENGVIFIQDGLSEDHLQGPDVIDQIYSVHCVSDITIPLVSECKMPVSVKGISHEAVCVIQPQDYLPTAMSVVGGQMCGQCQQGASHLQRHQSH